MSTSPIFADYGDTGDLAGARRARKAFRYITLCVLLLTSGLWLAEGYLRYSSAERLYILALRHAPDSALVFLRGAVETDSKTNEIPTAKYYQALAVREEPDRMINAYTSAYEADPQNPLFALQYGTALFEMGRTGEAAEIFRNSTSLPLENALPGYLEAAAVAHMQRGEGNRAFEQAMIILARSNNNREPLVFPRPLWHVTYPADGKQYADLQRDIERSVVRPLRYMASQISAKVESRMEAGEGALVRSWIDQGFQMGKRLLEESEPVGVITAHAGISIQLEMLELRQALREHLDEPVSEEEIEQIVRCKQALSMLEEFEQGREAALHQMRASFLLPLEALLGAAAFLFSIYLITFMTHKLLHLRKTAWSIPHSTPGRWMLGLGSAGIVLLLLLMVALQRLPGPHQDYNRFLQLAWWTLISVLVGFGPFYPAFTIPSPEDVTRKAGRLEEMEDLLRMARHTYARVYFSLIFRYYGILCGLYICIACAWIVGYRVLLGDYPWQLNLLVPGMLDREIELTQTAISLLHVELP